MQIKYNVSIKKCFKNELRKAEKLQNKSIDDLKEIARLRRIKNYDNLTKKDLIFSLLRSESNPVEHNYMKYFNNSTNDEIKSKINDIRLILSRLGNIRTKNDREKIKKDIYEIKKRQNLSNDLLKLANTLEKKRRT